MCKEDRGWIAVPCAGNLYYRGYNIKDLVQGFLERKHSGFEEIAYLLLFGELPNKEELADFQEMMADRRMLPPNFVRDVIMKAPSRDMMNSMSSSIFSFILMMTKADDTRHSECTASVSEPDQPVPDADGVRLSCI